MNKKITVLLASMLIAMSLAHAASINTENEQIDISVPTQTETIEPVTAQATEVTTTTAPAQTVMVESSAWYDSIADTFANFFKVIGDAANSMVEKVKSLFVSEQTAIETTPSVIEEEEIITTEPQVTATEEFVPDVTAVESVQETTTVPTQPEIADIHADIPESGTIVKEGETSLITPTEQEPQAELGTTSAVETEEISLETETVPAVTTEVTPSAELPAVTTAPAEITTPTVETPAVEEPATVPALPAETATETTALLANIISDEQAELVSPEQEDEEELSSTLQTEMMNENLD